ncbi:MAG TPA: DNA primase [Terriglobales bacterium]|nr:DNA primase [Terriglobales bacterium]
MPASDFKDALKQQADIVRVVGDYVKLKKAGAQNYSGLCPFHNEKTPSFSVHATRQFFHCFGCGVSGDVFSFVQKVENITFPEAVRLIAQKLGVAMPKVEFSSPQEAREARLRMALLDVHERACAFFQDYLKRPEGAAARVYLAGRGLDEETVARFRIGYAPDSGFLLRDALRKDFDEELLRESGLFSWKEEGGRQVSGARSQEKQVPLDKLGAGSRPAQDDKENKGAGAEAGTRGGSEGAELRAKSQELKAGSPEASSQKPAASLAMYSKFRNRITFPIANDAGRIIAFTGRTLSTDEKTGPKYLNSPETAIYSKSRVLFNLDHAKEAIRKLDYAILVEGQMDCISVFAAGFQNVIASSGTAFTELQAKLLGRFSKNVVVNFDPDTAGARATDRTLGLLVEEEFQVKVLRLEHGFDPDLFIRRQGKDAYAEVLRHSQRYFDYLIERARAQFPTRTPEGKVKAINHLLPHIQRVPSRIVRDELAHEIAQKLGIDSAVLRQELKHVAATRSAAAVKAPVEAQITDAERILVRALASAHEMQAGQGHLSARDGAEEEFDPARQARFAIESERLHEGLATESLVETLLGGALEVGDVMELPFSEGDRRRLATILLKEDEELTAERLEGAVRALRRIHLRRRLDDVQRQLESAGRKDPMEMQALLQEKVRLKHALRDPSLAGEDLQARQRPA